MKETLNVKHLLQIATTIVLSSVPLLGARAQSTAAITEFPTPSSTSLPQGLDIALDGSVWFTETAAGKLAVLLPNLAATEYAVPNGGQPVTLKVGLDGIWFTDATNHAIGLLNVASGAIQEYTIPSGAAPLFLQLGLDGSKWFSEPTGVGRLALNGVITQWDVTLEHPDDNIEQLSIDRAGDVWFVERNFDGAGAAGTNKVRRLDPRTNVISTYVVPTLGGNPAGVHANLDGSVWVSEYFANAFALLDPIAAPHSDAVVAPNGAASANTSLPVRPAGAGQLAGARTGVAPSIATVRPVLTPGWAEYFIPTPDAQAEDMRVDLLGRLWFEEDTGRVGVLNPYIGQFKEYTIPSVNSGYYNIALDPLTPRLWFTEAGAFAAGTPTKIAFLGFNK